MTRYMVIERFDPGNLEAIYDRLSKQGRGLPDGLTFIDSWLTSDNACVYQLMETSDYNLLNEWSDFWSDLVTFEFIELRDKPASPK